MAKCEYCCNWTENAMFMDGITDQIEVPQKSTRLGRQSTDDYTDEISIFRTPLKKNEYSVITLNSLRILPCTPTSLCVSSSVRLDRHVWSTTEWCCVNSSPRNQPIRVEWLPQKTTVHAERNVKVWRLFWEKHFGSVGALWAIEGEAPTLRGAPPNSQNSAR